MHQMAITDLDAAWVVALLGGQKLVSYVIERDQDAIDILMELEDTFWRKYVLTQTPPPIDGSERTTEAIRDAFTEPSADVIELPSAALDLVREIHAAAAEEKLAQERADAARNTLRMLLGEAEVGMYGGWPLATWKKVEQERIDVDELRAREPSLAARYAKTTSYRRLHLPKHKEVTA
jgi:predicted phage-related endonuclease